MSETDQPGFDDPAFDDVRALLGEARVTEAMPGDVADRLDATLSSLQAERRAEQEADRRAAVVPLRRRLGPLLTAAAAIVVIGAGGFGIAHLDGNGNSSDSAASSDKAVSGTAGDAPTAPYSGNDAITPEAPAKTDGRAARAALPKFTTAGFAEEAATFEADRLRDTSADEDDGKAQGDTPAPTAEKGEELNGLVRGQLDGCVGPDLAGTKSFPIKLDGRVAVLVIHPVDDGTQAIEAWSCDGTTVLTTAVVTR
jgi:hypothetical protein